MFNVGDYVLGDNLYNITNHRSLCEIIEMERESYCRVRLIATDDSLFENKINGIWGEIYLNRLTPITIEEYQEMYPNAYWGENEEMKTSVSGRENANIMENKTGEVFVLSSEQRNQLKTEIRELLEEYDYEPSDEGMDKILDEWQTNKSDLILAMQNHPNYNGKYQIVFDTDFNREVDASKVADFYQLCEMQLMPPPPAKIGAFTYNETSDIYTNLESKVEHYDELVNLGETILQQRLDELITERAKWRERTEKFLTSDYVYMSGEMRHAEAYKKYQIVEKVLLELKYYTSQFIDDEMKEKLSEITAVFPKLKPATGQKTSRFASKLCSATGIDKMVDFNSHFAKYADAINPLKIKRHTVLSVHPVDYYTMSFGNSWASCHTIDKQNARDMPNHYSGQYSSGTESYMLDGTSLVFYTVDASYDGDCLELEDKINRCMFHIGKDKIIQGRVYPQAMDGSRDIYKDFREIVQKVVSECYDVPNLWVNVKGITECGRQTLSYGTHYKDYTNFSNCNVSYYNGTGKKNLHSIMIGHDPICPACGQSHNENENIMCEDCQNPKRCYKCGDEDCELHYIDGDWYCEDCCFYCEYHDEWETCIDERTYITHYGWVCDDALRDADEFGWCDHCNEYYSRNDDEDITAEDGSTFCCSDCALNHNYQYSEREDEWYHINHLYYCEKCDEYVLAEDYNCEAECCERCLMEE